MNIHLFICILFSEINYNQIWINFERIHSKIRDKQTPDCIQNLKSNDDYKSQMRLFYDFGFRQPSGVLDP
jgi:hypothetical protein